MNPSVFRKFSSIEKKNMEKRGHITIFSQVFMSHSAQNSRREILLFLRKFLSSKSFYGWKGGYHVFPSKFFGLTVPKKFVGIPLMFQKFWVIEKFYSEWGVSQVSIEIFLSHSAEKFRGHPFNVSENLSYRKILFRMGGITGFHRNFFVSQCGKISWASLHCFRKFGVSKNFMHNRRYHNFTSKIFLSNCRKISWASFQCLRKFGVSKNFMHNRGYHKFSSKIFRLSAEKLRKGILYCFNNFGHQKKLRTYR